MSREELVAARTSRARGRPPGRARSAGARPRRARTRDGASRRGEAPRWSRSCRGLFVGRPGRIERPPRRELLQAGSPPLPERPCGVPRDEVERPRVREELVAVERAAAGQRRDRHAMVPPVEHRERAGEGTAGVAEHAHIGGQPARIADVDVLVARRESTECEGPQAVRSLGPHGRESARLERREVEPGRDDLAKHRWAPDRPPRGIGRAVEFEFQEHPHVPRV